MDLDQLARTVKDLEYRVRALEKAQGKRLTLVDMISADIWHGDNRHEKAIVGKPKQFCSCGRDLCRAPDCPSHKPDPMGR